MRVLFMGTPDFAVGCMRALCENGFDVAAAVSQPDRPKGRGHKLQMTAVHAYAESMGIVTYQPQSIKNGELQEVLDAVKPEVIVVVAYGKILPEYVLNYPKYGCINVHASLLPKYRGAAPIQWSIINGETLTGVTTMYMEKGLDTGDMILKKSVEITADETAQTLHDKLMRLGAEAIVETLNLALEGKICAERQDDTQSCYAPMINKSTALIDWSRNAGDIINLVRGMNPYPFAYTYYKGKMMKIGVMHSAESKAEGENGTIAEVSRTGITVLCGGGAVLIKTVQFEGKKMMSVSDYIMGHEIEKGVILGKE